MSSPGDLGSIDFIGPLPPPVHGLSNANAAVCEALAGAGYALRRHNLSPRPAASRLGYHLSRLGAVLAAVGGLLRRRPKLVYMSVDGGLGLAYGVLLVLTARLAGAAVAAHHHSFAYIDRPSLLMRLFLAAAPRRCLHVFLCGEMQSRFGQAYRDGRPAQGLVLTNAFMVPVDELQDRAETPPGGMIVLGHLSNLSREKGADLFLGLFDRLVACGRPVRAVLAGPVSDPALEWKIGEMRARHGARFDYRGPVYGEAKAAFFASIHVFVFPSRYVNEAQPLVLVEALARGRPLMTIARGCIACDHRGEESLVADSEATFAEESVRWLDRLIETPGLLADLSAKALDRAESEAAMARDGRRRWLRALAELGAAA